MRLWAKLRRIFTLERLIWCGATALTAVVFLMIGLTSPRMVDFPKQSDVVQTSMVSISATQKVDMNITTSVYSSTMHRTVGTVRTVGTFGTTTSSIKTTSTTTIVPTVSTSITADSYATTSANRTYIKVPINTATKEELMSVPGIGDVFSQRIIDYRESHGGFTDLSELMNINGIGEKRYKQWKEYFTLD